MNTNQLRAVLLAGMAGSFLVAPVKAQVLSLKETMAPQRGLMTSGNYTIDKAEDINISSGALGYTFHLASLPPGPGGTTYGLDLRYNSEIFDVAYDSFGDKQLVVSDSGGWQYGYKYRLIGEAATQPAGTQNCGVPGSFVSKNSKMSIIFPDGSHHTMRLAAADDDDGNGYFAYDAAGVPGPCVGALSPAAYPDMYFYSSDGTYLRLVTYAAGAGNAAQWKTRHWDLFFPDGRKVSGIGTDATRIQDANGYGVNITSLIDDCFVDGSQCASTYSPDTTVQDFLTDDLSGAVPNRKISLAHVLDGSGNVSYDQITALGANSPSSPQLTTKVYFGSAHVEGDYYKNSTDETFIDTYAGTVSSLVLPAASSGGTTPTWTFGYDYSVGTGGGWGELNSVTTPTGAIISYTYALHGGGVRDLSRLTVDPVVQKVVDSGATDTWSYDYAEFGSAGCTGSELCTKVTDPSGAPTRHYRNGSSTNSPDRGLTYRVVHPDGSTDETLWWHNRPWSDSEAYGDVANPYRRETAHSVAVSGTPSKEAFHVMTMDKNGNTIMSQDYDWIAYSSTLLSPGCTTGTGAISGYGTLLRTTLSIQLNPQANDCNSTNPTGLASTSGLYFNLSAPPRMDLPQYSLTFGTGPGSAVALAYDGNGYGTATSGPGNPTSEWHWDSAKASISTFLSSPGSTNARLTTRTFSGGNVTEVRNGVTTGSPSSGQANSYSYDSNNLYLTGLAFGNGLRNFSQAHDTAGFLTSETDTDNGVTTSYTRDDLGRVTARDDGSTRYSTWTYRDPTSSLAPRVIAITDRDTYGDAKLVTATTYDKLGRPELTRSLETAGAGTDDTAGIKVSHFYGYASNVSYEQVTNPYRASSWSGASSEANFGWTTSVYDGNGRIVQVAKSDAAGTYAAGTYANLGNTLWDYSGEYTMVNEANQTSGGGVKRQNTVDGLGRLTAVQEDPDTTMVDTSYGYDSVGNLTGVTQGSTGRSFSYDSLAELTSATNPETGSTAITWTWDDYGNPHTKSDGRLVGLTTVPVSTTMNYDALGRITSKSYSDSTPGVTYGYDAVTYSKGLLTSVTSSAATRSITSYDILGRPTGITQTAGGITKSFSHTWNLAGGLTTTTLPSTRVLTWTYDDAGRFTNVTGTLNSATETYASSPSYTPHGGLASLTLGNGITETATWTQRLQPAQIQAGSLMTLNYVYDGTGILNNGNVISQSVARTFPAGTDTWSQVNTYDSFNRLTEATETGPGTGWTQSFWYDTRGNRSVTAYSGLTAPTNETPVAATPVTSTWYGTNNRIREGAGTNPWTYDGVGNILTVGGLSRSFEYDAENRQTKATINSVDETYEYDGEGRRVTKVNPTGTTIYLYDGTGELAAEYATVNPPRPGTQYLSVDALGSTRLETDGTGQPVKCTDFLPFGEEIDATVDLRDGGTPVPTRCYTRGEAVGEKKFTGKERDATSGLDYFGARYLSSAQGRFTSPDEFPGGIFDHLTGQPVGQPGPLPYADISDPQTLNKYAYVRNNPLRFTDPDGHCIEDLCIGEGAAIYAAGAATVTYLSSPAGQHAIAATLTLADRAATSLGNGLLSLGKALIQSGGRSASQQDMADLRMTFSKSEGSGGSQPKSNPLTGEPGTTNTTTHPDGTPKQTRKYGKDGYPDTDVDQGHDHGQGDPHAHDWTRPANGSPPTHKDRLPGRPVKKTDPQGSGN